MADFVAVIRRAVDGLSDNNAEMRLKVYEKARGAVRRQLEAMNPRPSDELVKRQLDKLEAAINDVEVDHAEALPAEDIAPVVVDEDIAPAPVPEIAQHEPEPEPVAEQAIAAVEPEVEHEHVQPERYDEPVEEPATAPVEYTVHDEEPAHHSVTAEPVAETYGEPKPFVAPDPVVEPEPVVEPQAVAEEEPFRDEPQQVSAEAHIEPSWHVEAAPADDYVPSWQEPTPEHEFVAEAEVVAVEAVPAAAPDAEVYAVRDELAPEAEPLADARMPSAEAQWNWNEAASVDFAAAGHEKPAATDKDPLAWEWPEDRQDAKQDKPVPAQEWSDLDDLLGHTSKAGAAAAGASGMAQAGLADATPSSPIAVETARAPQRSFRAEPRKSRINFAAIAAIIGLIAIVGGAGAGYWFNRDSVNGWVNERIASFTEPSGAPSESAQTNETAEGGRSLPANTTPADDAQTTDTATEGAATEVASAGQGNGKFTERLLKDGSEVDEGPAAALDGSIAEEGKSVAAQTTETAGVAIEGGAATAGGETAASATEGTTQTPADSGAATTADAQTPAATGEQPAAIGVTQKMFLYEERLGQTAPTAIEGTVAWSSAEESPGGDAKPEPVVRAQVNVPSKGLTALITFRRNGDRSLPASHLVEIVFSLPEGFEGGGIDSVQRVAMKRTEQDRGDALIAVPAKITDDFHMIALNDFPEAIAKNTELLRTRSWIDIPITYRNGRRALMTMDKGTAGAEAFDSAMKAWATLGSPNSQ
jgi:hypothetical protein